MINKFGGKIVDVSNRCKEIDVLFYSLFTKDFNIPVSWDEYQVWFYNEYIKHGAYPKGMSIEWHKCSGGNETDKEIEEDRLMDSGLFDSKAEMKRAGDATKTIYLEFDNINYMLIQIGKNGKRTILKYV